jgi:DNA/RNA-binding domain of Phe-tRNA-synthetase-like protein
MFTVSEAFQRVYPGAYAGALVMQGVTNPDFHAELDQRRAELEKQLRERYAGLDRAALKQIATIQAYNAYYARFDKSYHVQLQLESVLLKGRSVGRGAALVQAMFMAEIQNLLLTAGHDLETIQMPVTVNVATGDESYTLLRGQEQVLKPGDMFMSDGKGIISSVLYGPDSRTQITASTASVLFTVYAPVGVGAPAVRKHLQDLGALVQLVSPAAQVHTLEVWGSAKV